MHPGDIVAGKYRVVAVLSRTGGLLLEARHTEFDQRVVIRMISPSLSDEKEIERFRREAQTLSKLESEHAARILDVGTHSDGSFFLVRQFFDGIDLATHLRNHGALRLEEAVLFILQAGEAIQECHSQRILLREIQPAHLFLTHRRGGTPMIKIIDFGTAKLLKDPAAVVPGGEATATVMFGMSPYTSPELVRKSNTIDARTDVWSLGCIFYELLAAVPPFQGEMAELMLKIARDEPLLISSLRPDLPRELDQIMAWALAKDPNSRFSSVYALAHALKPYASNEGQMLIDRIGRIAHSKPPPPARDPVAVSPTSPLSRRAQAAKYSMSDEATMLRAPASSHGGTAESEFERTAFIGDASEFERRSEPARPGSVPPPASRPSFPSFSDFGGRPGASWTTVSAEPELPALFDGTGGDGSELHGSAYSATATGGYPASVRGMAQRSRQRRTAMIAFGASLVLLPVLVMLLVIMLRDSTPDGELAQNEATPAPAPVANEASEPEAAVDNPADSEEPAAPAPAVDEPGDQTQGASEDGAPSTSPTARPGSLTGQAPAPAPRTPEKEKKDKKAPPPPEPEPEAEEPDESGMGTLVAIAIGGSCAFAVDGAPKGMRSSIRIQVPVGPHTVSCSPPGKATRTQRVNVKPGKPGIASFRLN
jgi:serine/threonine-protein kinase